MKAFKGDAIPWHLKGQYNYLRRQFVSLRFSHNYREYNFRADKLAEKGARS